MADMRFVYLTFDFLSITYELLESLVLLQRPAMRCEVLVKATLREFELMSEKV
jgi:hypothetical protein